jgi:hypothetical protein
MKKTILYVFVVVVLTMLTGCSAQRVVDTYNGLSVAMSGNKPPAFFKVDSIEEANDLKLISKHFIALMPIVREKDFKDMGGWHGSFHGKDLSTLYFYKSGFYHITFSSSINPYTERERAIENGDVTYLRTRMPKKIKENGEIYNITLKTLRIGTESYPCIARESIDPRNGQSIQSYGCFKSNTDKTLAKAIGITLTYTRVPNLPNELEALANEYTYEDLQKRSQRILDSLYIKDGWEK